jgi:parallel beta helix pectate lyase-like protein
MPTLRRTVAILTFPAIAYLGAACESDTPTGATAVPRINATVYPAPSRWVNVLDLTPNPPGTSCSDAGYMTINAAMAAASPNEVIQVCPGLYAEQVQIIKTLIILGAKVGVDARTRTTPPLPTVESIIDHPCGPVQIMADKVVLDGFTVQGSILSDPCFIAGIWSNPDFSGTQGGHTILNNIVQNNISGIELDSHCTFPTLVQFNLIQNNSMPGPGQGNGIETNFGLCSATIDNNKFSGDVSTSMLFEATQSNLTISNNELVGGTPERIFLINTSGSSITGNVSIGSTSSGTIRFFSGNSNVTVTGNTLFNGMRGIRVDDLDPFTPAGNSGIDAHFNCIQGNSIAGLEVASGDYTGTLHAENNWWGSPNGPMSPNNPGGTGDKIIDPDGVVAFIPFLKGCPTGAAAPRIVTGGGQVSVNIMGGRGSFGFSAKQETQSGHLDYMNHATRAHLNCTVNVVVISSATMAHLEGTCTTNSAAPTFKADVEDNGTPGKNKDRFKITYTDQFGLHVDEGGPGTIISGNIEIH